MNKGDAFPGNAPNVMPNTSAGSSWRNTMSPQKPFDVLLDEVIDTDIQVRKEDNADLGSSMDAEQEDFDFEG
jgi:hypothetical protein